MATEQSIFDGSLAHGFLLGFFFTAALVGAFGIGMEVGGYGAGEAFHWDSVALMGLALLTATVGLIDRLRKG